MQKYNFSAFYCESNFSFNYLELSVNKVPSRADISALVPCRNFFFVIPGIKDISFIESDIKVLRKKEFL
jgi:hypothetical protein